MLAHLVHPAFFRQSTTLLFCGSLVAAFLWWDDASAADFLPFSGLDASALGNVSSGDIHERGTIYSGLSLETNKEAVKADVLRAKKGESQDGNGLLRDAHRIGVFLGLAPTKGLELTLGLHGSYEHVSADDRARFVPEDDKSIVDDHHETRVKQSGFSGVSLMLKWRLLEQNGFTLALAPFAESGAGEQASYALTRSVSPRTGFLAIASYGARGVGELTVNGGYRYRSPETIGKVTLRNELVYGASLKGYLSDDFALFGAFSGRSIMVARGESDDTGGKRYQSEEAAELTAGLTARLGEADFSLYAGSGLNDAGFGYGRTLAGLSIGFPLGSTAGRRPRQSFADEVKNQADSRATLVDDSKSALDTLAAEDAYPEMLGDIDPLEAVGAGGPDDEFAAVEKRMEAERKANKGPSADAKVEAELKALNEAEAEAEADLAKKEAVDAKIRQQKAAEQSKEDDVLMKEWMTEAEEEANQLDGITDHEMQWQGLEK